MQFRNTLPFGNGISIPDISQHMGLVYLVVIVIVVLIGGAAIIQLLGEKGYL